MSGAGKSHWTRKLAGAGFRAISIDDRIERKLAPELSAGEHRGIGGVAAWMGWPDQPDYREREKKYLAGEIESMREVLDELRRRATKGSFWTRPEAWSTPAKKSAGGCSVLRQWCTSRLLRANWTP